MKRLSLTDIAEITKLLDESQFGSLDLQMGEFRLKIRRGGGSGGWARDEEDDHTPAPAPAASSAPAPAIPDAAATAGEVDVPAPLLGNFYAAPRPGEPDFVEVGDAVTPDTTIGIIEVMKLMNSVPAGMAGTVLEICAPNGDLVEHGQTLIRIQPH